MHTPPEGYKTVSIVRFTDDRNRSHRVGGPAEIRETDTHREEIYEQNGKYHRKDAPSYFLLHKATNTTQEEGWYHRGWHEREASDGPWHTERDPTTGTIVKQTWKGHSKLLVDRAGPWHIDPDYRALPDKPTKPKSQTERHILAFTRADDDVITPIKPIGHRDGNLPATITRHDNGTLSQSFEIHGRPGRTDGGPTNESIHAVSTTEKGGGILNQRWMEQGERGVYPRRAIGPANVWLSEKGNFAEMWAEMPSAHSLMKWGALRNEQGGPLWVPPEQRWPDGPNGPSQVLIHPDTGIRWYEARHNAAGELDRTDGPAQIIRDQKTGKTHLEKWARDGQPYEPTADERIQWEASQCAQTKRPGGVKAAAAAAAAKAAEAKTAKPKAADRGEER